ncbi:MAG TPA: hypothetical protein VNT33_10345 [Telluria sp.]|nr:hypothetical protein [Telluria sp.]
MPVYVQHEALGKVSDVFDAQALWQAPGLALFSRRPLLRDLLERSPRELRGRAATRCFSHVTLVLPQEEVDDDRHLTRGARARDLAESLAALHRKDFGDLLGGDDVRYSVVGAETLEPGEVEVKFGHAVYLPAPGEQLAWSVTASRDSAIWKPVCAIYPNQRLTLLGNDNVSATWAVPGWPFGPECAVLLVNDGPDAQVEVQVRPKDALECTYDAASGCYVIRQRRADGAAPAPRLLLRISRVTGIRQAAPRAAQDSAPARPAAVWKARPAVPQSADMTAVPAARTTPAAGAPEADATYAPVARQRVSLAALALPRLSRYRDTGAAALELGLDEALAPARDGKSPLISFAVTDSDEVHAITGDGRERIAIPSTFNPADSATVRLLAPAPEMADRYLALLALPNAPSQPVAPGARFVFGRSAPVLAALRVLDSPRFLRTTAGSGDASADRLGLSRQAFSFEAVQDGYQIARVSPTQALYHLDKELRFVAAIEQATPERPYLLPRGHHLVAGHYVLRFDV